MARAVKITSAIVAAVVLVLALGYLALLRPDIPYDELESNYANAASRFINVEGGYRIHYRDQGSSSAPALLLIHGFGASLETWEPWVAILGDRYRLVSVDLPGHGLTRAGSREESVGSMVEFIAAFAEAIELNDAVVAGNSLGGAVAWNLALKEPELVDGLVLIDSSGWEWTREAPAPLGFVKLLGSPAFRKIDKTAFVRQQLSMAYFDKSLVTTALVQRYVDLSKAPGHRDILGRMMIRTMAGEDPETHATAAKLSALSMPTLILWGAEDEMVDSEDAARFHAAIPHSTLIVYPNTGHVPMEEVAAQSAADVDAWLREVGLNENARKENDGERR